MGQSRRLGKASLGGFWRNLMIMYIGAQSPSGEDNISTKDLVLCQSTCCAMRALPHFSNVISNLNMYQEGLACPSQIPPIPVGMFKACSKQLDLNLISHLQDKHKNLLTWGAFTQVPKWEGWDCLSQLPPWTALFKLAAHRNFHRGREHLLECHKSPQPGPAVHSEPSLKCLHPNHTCTYFSKNRRKLSTRSLLTLVTQIQKYLQSS